MIVARSYKHRLRLTPEQVGKAQRFAGCARLVYNLGLEQRSLGYKLTGRSTSYYKQASDLPELKSEYSFLSEAPAQCLQQALVDLQTSFDRFFTGISGYPKSHKRGQCDSFRFPQARDIKTSDPSKKRQVYLSKLGWVSVINSYPRLGDKLFEGELKNVTVKREADGWYASFCCEVGIDTPRSPSHAPIGLDLGVTNSVTTSNGEFHHLPVATDREWEKLAIFQRSVSRKVQLVGLWRNQVRTWLKNGA